jgi:hypothetical protein
MKIPLSYQSTEYDCGPTTITNAINFLFDREEIPPEILKTIMLYCLDGYNEMGEAGKSGTTALAMVFISNWLNQYGKIKHFPIYTHILEPNEIHISQNSKISECLQQGGAAVVRVMLEGGHYVLLTGIDDEYIYLFDPYYDNVEYAKGIDVLEHSPKSMNRRVRKDILNSESDNDYAFGPIEARECMLMYNTDTRSDECEIEYMI